ncbi:MAG: hypothetical protein RLZZ606_1027 [Actinomycetota bacterium]
MSLFGTVAVLRTYLQQNTDRQITQAALKLANEDPLFVNARINAGLVTIPPLPGDYYIAFLDPQGRIYIGMVGSPIREGDVPNLSEFNVLAVEATRGLPFTADITIGDSGETKKGVFLSQQTSQSEIQEKLRNLRSGDLLLLLRTL